MSLARLWQQQGKCAEAHVLLAEVANGVVYVNGVRAVNRGEHKAAA